MRSPGILSGFAGTRAVFVATAIVTVIRLITALVIRHRMQRLSSGAAR